MDVHDLLDKATEFRFGPTVRVVLRGRAKGGEKLWAVTDGRLGVINRDLEWMLEPPPEGRSLAFLQETRFTLDEAYDVAQAKVDEMARDETEKKVSQR